MKVFLLLIIGFLGNLGIVQADIRSYIANFSDSSWEINSSSLKCQLRHEIPEYGVIEFVQEAGFPESSFLHLLYGRTIKHNRAEIKFLSPSWQNKQGSLNGWKFSLTKVGQPVIFSTRQSRRILDAIEDGLIPTIFHVDNNHRRDDIKASISSVRFTDAYNQYLTCQANIVPVSFAEIRNSAVYFDNASSRLDEESIKWLDYVLIYLKDPSVHRLELSGYTDSIGSFRANHQLASQRVEKIRDYLLEHGIDEKLMRLKVYGEQRAAFLNSTPEGRAKNRRVEIKLHR